MVKSMPAVGETCIWSLGQEDPGEGNGCPFQYSCLENSMVRGAGRLLQPMGLQRIKHDWATNTYTVFLEAVEGCTTHRVPALMELMVQVRETYPQMSGWSWIRVWSKWSWFWKLVGLRWAEHLEGSLGVFRAGVGLALPSFPSGEDRLSLRAWLSPGGGGHC